MRIFCVTIFYHLLSSWRKFSASPWAADAVRISRDYDAVWSQRNGREKDMAVRIDNSLLMFRYYVFVIPSRSQWPRGLRRRSAAARLLRLWVRIPPGAWMSVSCECRVLSGRGLCDELITRPEESYRLCCIVVCDLETSRMGAPYIYIWP